MVEKKGSRKQGSARDDEATHFFSALSRVFFTDFLPIQAVRHRPALAFCASTLVRIHTIAAIPGPCHRHAASRLFRTQLQHKRSNATEPARKLACQEEKE